MHEDVHVVDRVVQMSTVTKSESVHTRERVSRGNKRVSNRIDFHMPIAASGIFSRSFELMNFDRTIRLSTIHLTSIHT